MNVYVHGYVGRERKVDRVKLKEDGRKRGEIDTFSRSFKKKGRGKRLEIGTTIPTSEPKYNNPSMRGSCHWETSRDVLEQERRATE